MLAEADQERERYESRLKAQRDQYSFAKYAREEAMEQGLQQGLEKGQVLGRIDFCQRLLKLPLTRQEELLELPLVELQARAAALEQKLGALTHGEPGA